MTETRPAESTYIMSGDQGLENRVELSFGAPGKGRKFDPLRELAEGFAGRRAASFARLRTSEPFCAYVKRMAGTGPTTETEERR